MTYYQVKVYIKHKIKPLFIAIFEKEEQIDKFIQMLNDETDFIYIGSIFVKKELLRYGKIKEIHIKK